MPDEVARLVAVMEANLKGFTKGMDQAQKIADQKFGAIERRMNQTEKKFSTAFSGLSGLTRFLSAAALLSFGRSVLNTTSALVEQAQQVGVNVEAFQAYTAILKDNGATAQQAEQAIAKLTDKLGDAKNGSKEARAAFIAFGIDVNDLVRMRPEQALEAVARGAAKFTDEAKRASALSQVFGERVSRFLVPALGELSKGMDDNIAKMKEQGRVIDEELLKRADEARDRLGAAWDKLVANAAPAVTFVVEQLNNIIVAANKTADAIAGALQHAGEPLFTPGQTGLEFFKKLTPEQMQRIFNPLAGGGIAGAVPGRMGPAPPPLEIPATIELTPKSTSIDNLLKQIENEGLPQIKTEDLGGINDIIEAQLKFQMANAAAEDNAIASTKRQEAARVTENAAANADILEGSLEFWKEYNEQQDTVAQQRAEDLQRLRDQNVQQAADTIASLGVAALEGGESFKRAIDGMIRQIEFLIIKLLVVKALEATLGKASVLGGLVGAIGGFAYGGRPPLNRPSIVGERGPELFVPDSAGTIVPNYKAAAMGGGGRSIVVQVTNQMSFAGAIDQGSIRAMINQGDAATASGVVTFIRREFPSLMVQANKTHF